MKILTLIPLGMLSAILLIACSDETSETIITNVSAPSHLKSLNEAAANKSNQYDYIGLRYRDLLITYKSGSHNPSNFIEVDAIVQVLTSNAILQVNTTTKQTLLSSCINNPDGTLEEFLSSSGLSNDAKMILTGFIDNFETLSTQPFSQSYDQLTAIENNVINAAAMSGNDRRVVLAVASITRYSLYHSCCGDTDWGKSVGNIVAAIAGALESNNVAVEYSMIATVAQFEKVQI